MIFQTGRWLGTLALALILTACPQAAQKEKGSGVTSEPSIKSTDFAGIAYAQNTTHGVSVTWPSITNGTKISGYRIYRLQTLNSKPTLVGTVDPNSSSNYLNYIDGTAVSGSKYSYQVRAVDQQNNEDLNGLSRSVFAWSGLTDYTSSGNNLITVQFNPLTQNIYLRLSIRRVDPTDPTNNSGLTPNLVAVLPPLSTAMTNGSFSFTSYCAAIASDGVSCNGTIGLLPGAQYQIFAEVFEHDGDWDATPTDYCNNLEYPDCNPFVASFSNSPFGFSYGSGGLNVQTLSYGYGVGGNGSSPGWGNVTQVRAFGNSPGTQSSPNDLTAQFIPKNYQVDLVFKAFNLPRGYIDYEYVVMRTLATQPIDTARLNPPYALSLAATAPWVPKPYFQQVNSTTGTFSSCPVSSSANFTTTYMNPCVVVGCENLPRAKALNSTFWDSSLNYWKPSAVQVGSDPTIACTDVNAWAPNLNLSLPKYRYTLVMRHLDNASTTKIPYNENFSSDLLNTFSVVVPIPPDNMVLVNRESVNFEMCQSILSGAPDPLNFNRCGNKVAGAQTLNSGPGKTPLNLPVGFYDFGYNLFVDRYPLACNWTATSSVATGSFNYLSSGVTGSDGTVLYQTAIGAAATGAGTYNNCFVNISGVYQPMNAVVANAGILAPTYYRTALTNAPCDSAANGSCQTSAVSSLQRPKFSFPYWDANSANAACSSFSDPVYGSKRIPRMREFRAFNAPPISLQVNSTYISDLYFGLNTAASSPPGGSNTWRPGACVTNTNASSIPTSIQALGARSAIPTSLSGQFGGTNNVTSATTLGLSFFLNPYVTGVPNFLIGSSGDSDCVSRYGVAGVLDLPSTSSVFNTTTSNYTAWYPLSDAAYYALSSTTLTGQGSNIDSGNMDLSVDYTTFYNTGYVINAPVAIYYNSAAYATLRFNSALGLPMSWTGSSYAQNYGSNPPTASNFAQVQDVAGDTLLTYFPTATGIFNASGMARWTTGFTPSTTQSGGPVYNSRVRCVLSAD